MTIDEVKEKIKNKEYPHVARLSEPYLTRLSELTLVVNDVTYTAKIKDGVNVQGFMIYSSGLGIPVYEDLEKKNNGELNGKSKLKESIDNARKWIDELEIAIAETVNDNPIKKAIDRLCWQLHYDFTQSNTDFSTKFKDDDFSQFETGIDVDTQTDPSQTPTVTTFQWYFTELDTTTGHTIGSELREFKNVMLGFSNKIKIDTDSDSNTIFDVLKDTSEKIYKSGEDNTIVKTLTGISDKIVQNDEEPSTEPGDESHYFPHRHRTLYNALVGTNTASISSALNKYYNSSESVFSVAEALREGSDKSVSDSIESNTTTISSDINDVYSTLYSDTSGTVTTIYDLASNIHTSIGDTTDSSTASTMIGLTKSSNDKLGDANDTGTVLGKLGTSNSNESGILDRLGTTSDTSGTILGKLYMSNANEGNILTNTNTIVTNTNTIVTKANTLANATFEENDLIFVRVRNA